MGCLYGGALARTHIRSPTTAVTKEGGVDGGEGEGPNACDLHDDDHAGPARARSSTSVEAPVRRHLPRYPWLAGIGQENQWFA